MTDRGDGTWLKVAVWPVVAVGATLTIGGPTLALPLVEGLPASYLTIADRVQPGRASADGGAGTKVAAPLADLNAALTAARAKLEQLDRATAALAGVAALRAELAAKEEENQRLRTELQNLRARRVEWQRAEDAAKAQISGLGQALDEAAEDTKKLESELADLRWQNAQLDTSLSSLRSQEEAARAELGAQVDELTASAGAGAAEIERLNQELADRGAALAAATEAGQQSAARVAELEEAVAGAEGDLRNLGTRLAAGAERLNEVNATLAESERERDAALAALDEEQARADRLRDALAVAEADLEQAKALNRDLETRTASLEQAATAATDAAWQNLRAVESQIAALNSTLAEVELTAPAASGAAGTPPAAGTAPGEAAAGAPDQPAAALSPATDRDVAEASAIAPGAGPPTVANGEAPPANGEAALVRLSRSDGDASIGSLAMVTDALPVEGRIQARSLLADLEAEIDPQGLKLIVPGEELFTVNSEEVRSSAHESLAKVAELINLYKDQPIMIIGHTDAVGATEYNETLSLRRASLVREFFIEHFDVDADRLATQGMGEQRPIASNATAAGRRANRRVEVLILK